MSDAHKIAHNWACSHLDMDMNDDVVNTLATLIQSEKAAAVAAYQATVKESLTVQETAKDLEIQRLREALKFYSDKNLNIYWDEGEFSHNTGEKFEHWGDEEHLFGSKARQALSAPTPDPSNILKLAAGASTTMKQHLEQGVDIDEYYGSMEIEAFDSLTDEERALLEMIGGQGNE